MQEDEGDNFCDADEEPEAGVLSRMIGNKINKFESTECKSASKNKRDALKALVEEIAEFKRKQKLAVLEEAYSSA